MPVDASSVIGTVEIGVTVAAVAYTLSDTVVAVGAHRLNVGTSPLNTKPSAAPLAADPYTASRTGPICTMVAADGLPLVYWTTANCSVRTVLICATVAAGTVSAAADAYWGKFICWVAVNAPTVRVSPVLLPPETAAVVTASVAPVE